MSQPLSYRADVAQTFTFPAPSEAHPKIENLQEITGFKSVTVRELRKSDEAQAISLSGNDGGQLLQRMVGYSVVRAVKVDGTVMEITSADDSIDVFMSSIGPKGRALVAAAYNAVNQPRQEAAEVFLASASMSVQ